MGKHSMMGMGHGKLSGHTVIRHSQPQEDLSALIQQAISVYNEDLPQFKRPSDWIPLPTIAEGNEGINMLVAVYNDDTNYFALDCENDYSVDWGDGSGLHTYIDGVTANHDIDWDDIASSTLTSDGYKQAIITITPANGMALGDLRLTRRHGDILTINNTMVLQIIMRGPSITAISFAGAIPSSMRSFEFLGTCNVTRGVIMFAYCYALEECIFDVSAKFDNCSEMFRYCTSLVVSPKLSTHNCTLFVQMFEYCYALRDVYPYDMSINTSCRLMFHHCDALTHMPPLNTSSVLYFYRMFYHCRSLRVIGEMSLDSAVDSSALSSIVAYCYNLSWCGFTDIHWPIRFIDCNLGVDALEHLYGNLQPTSGNTYIHLKNNPGEADADTSIRPNYWLTSLSG